MKEIICTKCGIHTSQSNSSHSRQLKLYGQLLCRQCAKERGRSAIKQKLADRYELSPKNRDIISIECEICHKKKQLTRRSLKAGYTRCKSCAAKLNRRNNSIIYDQLSSARKGDQKFSKAVSTGLMSLPNDKRSALGKSGASYWSNAQKRENVLAIRDTETYRTAISNGLLKPEVREILSSNAKKHWRRMWSNPMFREKMAGIRSSQQRNISGIQKTLYSYLDDLGISYIKEHPLGPWCFDCFISDHNLLIECQGEYWHSLPKAIRNDKAKATYISQYFPEYRILYLFESDFGLKEYICTRLKHELGITKLVTTSIDFNSITMKVVDSTAINNFMYRYHYIGPKSHALNFGFFCDEELIACASYSGTTRAESATRLGLTTANVRELSRFCIHPNYHIKNLASYCISKTIKWIKQNRPLWSVLIAFADPSINHLGTIYKASNWEYDGVTDPSYYYVDLDGFVMHKKTLYNYAVKNKCTESEYALKHGYRKRFTPGKHRFIYQLASNIIV